MSKTDKKELKFHTRARGNNQGCLSVDTSFILGTDTGFVPYASKNRPLLFVICYVRNPDYEAGGTGLICIL